VWLCPSLPNCRPSRFQAFPLNILRIAKQVCTIWHQNTLPPSKLHFICDMIQSQLLTTSQMADAAECSKLTIENVGRNLRQFGSVHAPLNCIGPRRSISAADTTSTLRPSTWLLRWDGCLRRGWIPDVSNDFQYQEGPCFQRLVQKNSSIEG
jgi:hypothetical protein